MRKHPPPPPPPQPSPAFPGEGKGKRGFELIRCHHRRLLLRLWDWQCFFRAICRGSRHGLRDLTLGVGEFGGNGMTCLAVRTYNTRDIFTVGHRWSLKFRVPNKVQRTIAKEGKGGAAGRGRRTALALECKSLGFFSLFFFLFAPPPPFCSRTEEDFFGVQVGG